MHDLRDKGNTLLVVEHEEAIIRAADHLLDIGPGRGEHLLHAAGGWSWQHLGSHGQLPAAVDVRRGPRRIDCGATGLRRHGAVGHRDRGCHGVVRDDDAAGRGRDQQGADSRPGRHAGQHRLPGHGRQLSRPRHRQGRLRDRRRRGRSRVPGTEHRHCGAAHHVAGLCGDGDPAAGCLPVRRRAAVRAQLPGGNDRPRDGHVLLRLPGRDDARAGVRRDRPGDRWRRLGNVLPTRITRRRPGVRRRQPAEGHVGQGRPVRPRAAR